MIECMESNRSWCQCNCFWLRCIQPTRLRQGDRGHSYEQALIAALTLKRTHSFCPIDLGQNDTSFDECPYGIKQILLKSNNRLGQDCTQPWSSKSIKLFNLIVESLLSFFWIPIYEKDSAQLKRIDSNLVSFVYKFHAWLRSLSHKVANKSLTINHTFP